jgi:Ni/Fe-hydrogenase 1 B-type cytochrome subunit
MAETGARPGSSVRLGMARAIRALDYFHDGHGSTAYVMGTMRFFHLLSGFAFIAAILIRIVWMFIGNRWSHWNQFIPTTKERLGDMIATARYYGFMAWSAPPHIGHNAMAGSAYAAVFGMAAVEISTGLALYSQVLGNRTLGFFVGWITRVVDIQWLREIHFLLMFGFWMFFVHHLYTCILVAVEEENGLMESIFSGYKFVPEHELREGTSDERSVEPEPRPMRANAAVGHNSQPGA